MSQVFLEIQPRDSIVARDGRPFGLNQGRRMKPLDWPLPSVVAGSLRTAVVKATSHLQFDDPTKQALKSLEIAGAFPAFEDELYLPAPVDCVTKEKREGVLEVLRVRPQEPGTEAACDLPAGLRPVMLGFDQADEGFKPGPVPAWWPATKLGAWLAMTGNADPKGNWFDDSFLDRPTKEFRDHVCLDSDRGAADEGKIYQTATLRIGFLPKFGAKIDASFDQRHTDVSLAARVIDGRSRFEHLESLSCWHPLGGERRLVHWRAREKSAPAWQCPSEVRNALSGNTRRVRMLLASPAIFKDGWRPGWLDGPNDGPLQGKPPIPDAPILKLVAASVPRWQAVSGWSYEPVVDPDRRGATRPGPKPIRRMVPAGAVYFFEVVEGDASKLAEHGWLRPVSDDEQERRDGFGLAAWGVW